MDLATFDELAAAMDGVRRSTSGGARRWTYQGRLVARELDPTHVVVRTPFGVRASLLDRFPESFSVPTRFRKHMKVVVDLDGASEDAIQEALVSAWDLQASHG